MDFSPAGNVFAGDELYESDSDISGHMSGSESSSENEGAENQFDDEEASEEEYEAERNVRGSLERVKAPVRSKEVVTDSVAMMAKLGDAINMLSTELSLMRTPSSAIKLTAEQLSSGVQHRRVKFFAEMSLEEASKSKKQRLTLLGDAKKIFGASNIMISSIEITEIDNRFPVSLELSADHLTGNKICTEPTVTNDLVMADCVRAARKEYATPLCVYKSTENNFSRDFSLNFPEYTASNLQQDITEVRSKALLGNKANIGDKKLVLVPRMSPVMTTIQRAREANKDIVDEATYFPPCDAFAVTEAEALRAINAICQMLAESDESTPVDKVFFEFKRSNVTASTLQKIDSESTNAWKDPAEIGRLIKSGQTKETAFQSVKSLTVTATIAFRPLAGK